MRHAEADEADDPDVTPETVTLRDDIEQTRAEMSGTIDAIQDRLDPEVLQEQAKDTIREAKEAAIEVADHAIRQAKDAVRDATGQAGAALRGATIGKVEDMARYAGDTAGGWRHTLVATVKAHPVPAALAGLTLGYLFLNRESGTDRPAQYGGSGATGYRDSGYRDTGYRAQGYDGGRANGGYDSGHAEPSVAERAGDMAGQAQERAGQAMGQVQETAGQVVDQVQETAGQVVDQVQEQAHRAQSFLGRQLEENPLAVGAVAVVLGGALGALIGTTSQEDRYFGEARDRLMGRAGEMTQDTMEKVGRVVDEAKDSVERATEEVKSTVQSEARAQDLLPKETRPSGSGSPGPRPSGPGAPASTAPRPS